jgi:BirA family biotin operon repressor/biotin-[acetyl-CoA-carboxylase] ligase
MTVVLRPPAEVVELCTSAVAVAAAEAVEAVCGFAPRCKWPNDLVWPGDGSGPDRKLAGILAEADWPAGSTPDAGYRPPRPRERIGVVVGLGINTDWPEELPEELVDVAVACNHVTGVAPDREDLLVALLERLDHWYGPLAATRDRSPLLAAWRDRSATLGRRVRVDLGAHDVEGTAVELTDDGHLVVELLEGGRRTLAVGDVTHLRPTER